MGWIRIVGKGLEFSGKIVQSASFEDWAINEGEKVVDKFAEDRTIALFGRKRAAKKELWDNLKMLTERPALTAVLNDLASNYKPFIEKCVDVFEENEFIADGHVYVVPRFFINSLYEGVIRGRLDNSDEFEELKGGPELRSFFYKEFIEQLDIALRSLKPAPNNPVVMERTWYLVSADTGYDWRKPEERWEGYFLFFGHTESNYRRQKISSREQQIKDQVKTVELQLAAFTREEKLACANRWCVSRDAISNGKILREQPTLTTARH